MACLSWWQQIFETDRRNVKRRTECFHDEFSFQMANCQFTKFINRIHLRAAIDRLLRSLPLKKPFSVISDPTFTEANKALEPSKRPQNNLVLGVLETH